MVANFRLKTFFSFQYKRLEFETFLAISFERYYDFTLRTRNRSVRFVRVMTTWYFFILSNSKSTFRERFVRTYRSVRDGEFELCIMIIVSVSKCATLLYLPRKPIIPDEINFKFVRPAID